MERRTFLKRTAMVGTGLTIGYGASGCRTVAQASPGAAKPRVSPNSKLNVAVIGVGGRGGGNLDGVKGENIVALCDVNEVNLKRAAEQFPKATTYTDWRLCLDQKDIDAVVCSTTDHTHAFVNIWAMNRGKHVYCEKPLANSVYEARLVRETYLKNKDRIATQMGTQIHATDNFRRVVELVQSGVIGDIDECSVWCSRTPEGGTYLPEVTPVQDGLHWDLWLGPSPLHPYNPGYLTSGCLSWNRFWDFGSGQIGDMGSHMIDLAYWALDLRFPTSCEAAGTPLSPDTCPQWLTATWEHPATEKRPALKLFWYDGGKKPGVPSAVFNRDQLFKGVLFHGTKGWLLADYDYRIVMPMGDLTYCKLRQANELIPPSPGHHQEWITACKTGSPTLCNFDYAGALIENNLLALVAYRVGKRLEWDAKALKATNCPEADAFIHKTYRDGWVLNG
jgi:predicted dehydrogenase